MFPFKKFVHFLFFLLHTLNLYDALGAFLRKGESLNNDNYY